MSLSALAVLVSGALIALLLLVHGCIATVALLRAKAEDVPGVLADSVNVFRSLVNRLPGVRAVDRRRDEEE